MYSLRQIEEIVLWYILLPCDRVPYWLADRTAGPSVVEYYVQEV